MPFVRDCCTSSTFPLDALGLDDAPRTLPAPPTRSTPKADNIVEILVLVG